MANLDRIVNVQIALRTAGVQQLGFSDLMLMGVFTYGGRVLEITGADDLLNPAYGIADTSDLYRAAQAAFSQIPAPRRIFVGKRNSGESITQALAACRDENPNWYVYSDVSHTPADILSSAAWSEANQRIYVTAISEAEAKTAATSGNAYGLKNGNFFRTAWWYHTDLDQFPEVAAAAAALRIDPGGETWANMRLRGLQATPLIETDYGFIKAKNGNTFEPFRDLSITQGGKVAGGEWIDIIRFRDWLCEEIRTRVFNAFVDTRIPYTDDGIAVVKQAMIGALDLGVRRKGISPPEALLSEKRIVPSYTITVPNSTDVSISDKAARVLNDVRFSARLSGAIHAVNINGVLTYDNILAGAA